MGTSVTMHLIGETVTNGCEAPVAYDCGSTLERLLSAATRAADNVGPGSGPVYGRLVHSAFQDEVRRSIIQTFSPSRSCLNGAPVGYGTPGSIRIDVGEGTVDSPTAIFDLKAGSATLTPARIVQFQSHLPEAVTCPYTRFVHDRETICRSW